MKTRVLATAGQGIFVEKEYECPDNIDNGIIVKAVMTGVCTSDISMMKGEFGPLPLHMQGHEGLGQVIKIGKDVTTNIQVGDYVATRGEPAYADFYPVREGEFVKVPAAQPQYIIEPVACGINVVLNNVKGTKILIIGSGFLAYVAYRTLQLTDQNLHIDVVGGSNREIWAKESVELLSKPDSSYDTVINLKDKHKWLENGDLMSENARLIDALSRPVSQKENEVMLWKSVTTIRPSPRNTQFLECMKLAVKWVEEQKLSVESFWTRSYNRSSEWPKAFSDGQRRPQNYSRGYITWL